MYKLLSSTIWNGPLLAPDIMALIDKGNALEAIDLCISRLQRIPDELITLATEQLALSTPPGMLLRVERYIDRCRIVGTLVKPLAVLSTPLD